MFLWQIQYIRKQYLTAFPLLSVKVFHNKQSHRYIIEIAKISYFHNVYFDIKNNDKHKITYSSRDKITTVIRFVPNDTHKYQRTNLSP